MGRLEPPCGEGGPNTCCTDGANDGALDSRLELGCRDETTVGTAVACEVGPTVGTYDGSDEGASVDANFTVCDCQLCDPPLLTDDELEPLDSTADDPEHNHVNLHSLKRNHTHQKPKPLL